MPPDVFSNITALVLLDHINEHMDTLSNLVASRLSCSDSVDFNSVCLIFFIISLICLYWKLDVQFWIFVYLDGIYTVAVYSMP